MKKKWGEGGGWRGERGNGSRPAASCEHTHTLPCLHRPRAPSTRKITRPPFFPPVTLRATTKTGYPYLPSSTLHPPTSLLPKLVEGGREGCSLAHRSKAGSSTTAVSRRYEHIYCVGPRGALFRYMAFREKRHRGRGGGRRRTLRNNHTPAKNTWECSLSSLSLGPRPIKPAGRVIVRPEETPERVWRGQWLWRVYPNHAAALLAPPPDLTP